LADKPTSNDGPAARERAREQVTMDMVARDSQATLVPANAYSDVGRSAAEPEPPERAPAMSLGPIRSLRFTADDTPPQIDTKKPSAMRLNALAVPGSLAKATGAADAGRCGAGDASGPFSAAGRVRRLGAVAIGFVVVGGLTVAALLALRAVGADSPGSAPAVQGELAPQPGQQSPELEQARATSALGVSALSAGRATEPTAEGESEMLRQSRLKPAGAGESIADLARAGASPAARALVPARRRPGSARSSGSASRFAAPTSSARDQTGRAAAPAGRPAASAAAASERSEVPDDLYF
jgi:hypothetical protein